MEAGRIRNAANRPHFNADADPLSHGQATKLAAAPPPLRHKAGAPLSMSKAEPGVYWTACAKCPVAIYGNYSINRPGGRGAFSSFMVAAISFPFQALIMQAMGLHN
ncbi:hypothetical protein X474_08520 [Dethiosulfatarculus sandiegensis]|uniref:Uncharacterized protein n=1 Tax=Dethiosulfatarculus sandiegensis TaxID=1429043 RepID=A0A0D2JYP2_9BACT|nr:hypothetical protein X474_08520 [Dethiosulfatarculus sandiegensis]